jgi:hypothetical protein
MSKQGGLLDVVWYIIFLLVVWHVAHGHIDDYYAMLISTVFGMAYKIYCFLSIFEVHQ